MLMKKILSHFLEIYADIVGVLVNIMLAECFIIFTSSQVLGSG